MGKRLALDLPPAGGKLCEAFLEKRKARYRRVSVRQYCAEIDEAARNRMELIVRSLAEQNGVTEQLKADTKWNGYGR